MAFLQTMDFLWIWGWKGRNNLKQKEKKRKGKKRKEKRKEKRISLVVERLYLMDVSGMCQNGVGVIISPRFILLGQMVGPSTLLTVLS